MNKTIITICQFYIFINCLCYASVYDLSIRSFSEGKVFVVIKNSEFLGNYKGKDKFNYNPTFYRNTARLNNEKLKKLVFDNERYVWMLVGKKLMTDGLEGEKVKCLVASMPLTFGLDGETSLDVVMAVDFKVDYAFCEPIGDRDWILAGKDSGLALLPKELWFKDVKNDVPEYMNKLKIYDAAEEDGRLKLLMEDLKKWSDVRGLAVLEKLIELPSINVKDITSIINSKGNEFQIHSLSIVLNSNMPKEKKMQFTDPKSESSIKNTVPLLNLLAKWPIDPEDNFMIQVNLLLKQFTSN